jgi:hypothetical protein
LAVDQRGERQQERKPHKTIASYVFSSADRQGFCIET